MFKRSFTITLISLDTDRDGAERDIDRRLALLGLTPDELTPCLFDATALEPATVLECCVACASCDDADDTRGHCGYCLALATMARPPVSDGDTWAAIAAEHEPGCSWVTTRGGQIPIRR